MSIKYILGENGPELEDFGEALLCGGRVCLCETIEYGINEDPGQCWGDYVLAHAGSYVRTGGREETPQLLESDCIYSIDAVGAELDIITYDSESGSCTDYHRHAGIPWECEEMYYHENGFYIDQSKPRFTQISDFVWHEENGVIIIDHTWGLSKTILVPENIDGKPVEEVKLRDSDLSRCRELIVSKGVKRFGASFRNADRLRRLELPEDIELTKEPEMLSSTPWFKKLPRQPVYLGGWYIGTPGGGSGGKTELILRPGTVGVAAGADYSCFFSYVELPDSVIEVGDYAFSYSPCLDSVKLSDNLKRLGRCAFHRCGRLRTLELPDSLLPRATWAFTFCPALSCVSIGWRAWDPEATQFSKCPMVIVRREYEIDYVERETLPLPVVGTVTAYPKRASFMAAGKKYSNLNQLTVTQETDMDFLDRYERTVRCVRDADPRWADTPAETWEKRWYIKTPEGVTQIEVLPFDYTVLVRENLSANEVPEGFWRNVKDLFEEERTDEG